MFNKEKERILHYYCDNNAYNMEQLCNKLLNTMTISISDVNRDDIYSIANMVLFTTLKDFDVNKGVQYSTFYISALKNRIKTYIRDSMRDKRIQTEEYVSEIDGYGNEKVVKRPIFPASIDNVTLNGRNMSEVVADTFDVWKESEFYDESDKIDLYMKRLSKKQRKVLQLMIEGYKPSEIKTKLNLTTRDVKDSIDSIRAYENVKILMI